MPYLSNMLSRFDGVLGASHTFHIFIASSAGQIVNNRVPHGLMHEWPTAPACAVTLRRRRYEG